MHIPVLLEIENEKTTFGVYGGISVRMISLSMDRDVYEWTMIDFVSFHVNRNNSLIDQILHLISIDIY